MAKDTSRLTEIVSAVIEAQSGEERISPSQVATASMTKLRAAWMAKPAEYPLVYLGCHLELRQIARSLLRMRFEPEEDADKLTHPLFPDLQWRYPVKRGDDEEPQYLLLDLLSKDDWRFNIKRLREDARSRLQHADRLTAWGMRKFHMHDDPVV